MLDLLKSTLERNLLKYSAGLRITCKCGKVADYRDWVIIESQAATSNTCGKCAAEIFAKIHDEDPVAYLTEKHGWKVTTLITTAKMKRLIKAANQPEPVKKPYKPKISKKDCRHYPKAAMPKEPVVTNDDGAWSCLNETVRYVQEFCRMNHLVL